MLRSATVESEKNAKSTICKKIALFFRSYMANLQIFKGKQPLHWTFLAPSPLWTILLNKAFVKQCLGESFLKKMWWNVFSDIFFKIQFFCKTRGHARFARSPLVIRLGDSRIRRGNSGYGEVLSSGWHYNYKIGTVTGL